MNKKREMMKFLFENNKINVAKEKQNKEAGINGSDF